MDKDIIPEGVNDEYLKGFIYYVRGVRVMLDMDLAKIYGYSTKDFNRQVKNNIEKFEQDFMFQKSNYTFAPSFRYGSGGAIVYYTAEAVAPDNPARP